MYPVLLGERKLLLWGVWTRGGTVVHVLRTATVCIETVAEEYSVPVSVMRYAAVCHSITETYETIGCTAQNGLGLVPRRNLLVSTIVLAPACTPDESC